MASGQWSGKTRLSAAAKKVDSTRLMPPAKAGSGKRISGLGAGLKASSTRSKPSSAFSPPDQSESEFFARSSRSSEFFRSLHQLSDVRKTKC